MFNLNKESKGYKVTVAQEMITAQNSSNQSNEDKDIFNVMSEEELRNALTHYDLGIVKPEYAISLIKRAETQIDKARMADDAKALVKNAFGLVLSLIPENFTERPHEESFEPSIEYLGPDEIISHMESIEEGEDDEYGDYEELTDQIIYELSICLGDIDGTDYPEDELINVAYPFIEEYFDGWRELLEKHGDEINPKYRKHYDDMWKEYCDICKDIDKFRK